jgi:hypothetical protein
MIYRATRGPIDPPGHQGLPRAGAFTLVELLVAMALTLFIMVILSEAFVAGMQTFGDLKAVGDMARRLRTANSVIRADLGAMWLDSPTQTSESLSGRRPGPPLFQAQVPTLAGGRGFFRVWQDGPGPGGAAPTASNTVTKLTLAAGPGTSMTLAAVSDPQTPGQWTIQPGTVLIVDAGTQTALGAALEETVTVSLTYVVGTNPVTLTAPGLAQAHAIGAPVIVCEGADLDGIASVQSANHTLHFTVNLGYLQSFDRRQDYLSTSIADPVPLNAGSLWAYGPPAFRDAISHPYNSQWAEVVYFLRENGTSTSGDALANPPRPPMRLYGLYRRQHLALTPTETALYQALDPPLPGPLNPISSTLQYQYYFDMSSKPDPLSTTANLFFNNPTDLTIPERRYGMNATVQSTGYGGLPLFGPQDTYASRTYPKASEPIPTPDPASTVTTPTELPSFQGADLLLNDVISMDIQLYIPEIKLTDFCYLPAIPNPPANNNTYPNYQGKRVFDTWSLQPSSTANPYDYSASDTTNGSYKTVPVGRALGGGTIGNPTGIQIILRIWDQKTQKTRQVTIIQDL